MYGLTKIDSNWFKNSLSIFFWFIPGYPKLTSYALKIASKLPASSSEYKRERERFISVISVMQ